MSDDWDLLSAQWAQLENEEEKRRAEEDKTWWEQQDKDDEWVKRNSERAGKAVS